MGKFHINKNGVPAPCRAKSGNCPLGGDETHFNNQEEAQEYIDNKSQGEFGLLGTTSYRDSVKEKLQKLIDNIGTEAVIDELGFTLSTEELENVVDEIVSRYDLEDRIDKDDRVYNQMREIKKAIGADSTLTEMSQILSPVQLHENIVDSYDLEDYLDDKNTFTHDKLEEIQKAIGASTTLKEMSQIVHPKNLEKSIDDMEERWDIHLKENNESEVSNSTTTDKGTNYEEQLSDLGKRLNKHTKQLIEEVEQWLDDTEI